MELPLDLFIPVYRILASSGNNLTLLRLLLSCKTSFVLGVSFLYNTIDLYYLSYPSFLLAHENNFKYKLIQRLRMREADPAQMSSVLRRCTNLAQLRISISGMSGWQNVWASLFRIENLVKLEIDIWWGFAHCDGMSLRVPSNVRELSLEFLDVDNIGRIQIIRALERGFGDVERVSMSWSPRWLDLRTIPKIASRLRELTIECVRGCEEIGRLINETVLLLNTVNVRRPTAEMMHALSRVKRLSRLRLLEAETAVLLNGLPDKLDILELERPVPTLNAAHFDALLKLFKERKVLEITVKARPWVWQESGPWRENRQKEQEFWKGIAIWSQT